MYSRRILALGGAIAALTAAPVSIATAAEGRGAAHGTSVTVRVEGLSRTLLAPRTVTTSSGWITRFGAPTGKCPASSAAGALDAATRHRWVGTYDTSFGDYEITSILGEAHPFTSKYYWEIFVDNVSASKGACELALHHGEQLLFAAVPDSGTEYPIALEAPSSAKVGHAFEVTVVSFNARGKAKPLAGATVSVAGHSGTTGVRGTVSLTPSRTGTFVLEAAHAGYIRAAPVTLKVT